MKKQIKIFIVLTILPIILLGQNKFSVGLNVSSELSFMKIEESRAEEFNNGIYEEGGVGVGYFGGIQIQYNLKNQFFLRSGLSYAKSSYQHKIKGLLFGTDIQNGTTSSIVNDITISLIRIPVDLGYKIMTKRGKINFLAGIGGAINIKIGEKSEGQVLHDIIEDEKLTEVENKIDESLLSGKIFCGVEFSVNEKIALGIEPHLKYTPNDFTLYLYDSKSKTSMEVGLTIRLRMK